MSAHASTLDPTYLRCLAPMALTVSGYPLLPHHFLAECSACRRTVAVTLTARPLRAGRAHSPPELAGAPPYAKKTRSPRPYGCFSAPVTILEIEQVRRTHEVW